MHDNELSDACVVFLEYVNILILNNSRVIGSLPSPTDTTPPAPSAPCRRAGRYGRPGRAQTERQHAYDPRARGARLAVHEAVLNFAEGHLASPCARAGEDRGKYYQRGVWREGRIEAARQRQRCRTPSYYIM